MRARKRARLRSAPRNVRAVTNPADLQAAAEDAAAADVHPPGDGERPAPRGGGVRVVEDAKPTAHHRAFCHAESAPGGEGARRQGPARSSPRVTRFVGCQRSPLVVYALWTSLFYDTCSLCVFTAATEATDRVESTV